MEERIKVSLIVPKKLWVSLKHRSADTGVTLSELVERAIRKYLRD